MSFGDAPLPSREQQYPQWLQDEMNWDTGESSALITPDQAVAYLEKVLKSEIVEYRHQENLLSEEMDRVQKHITKLEAQLKAAQMARVIVRGTAR